MKRTLTLAVAGALLATLLGTTVAAAAAPSNDLHTEAIALTDTIPQSFLADTTEATVTTDDFGCGAGGADRASVWYSITTANGLELVIDPTASNYVVGVNVFSNSPGQENLATCFQGVGLVTLQAGVTYYLMFADTDLDATNGGMLSVTLDAPPPPLEVAMTIDPTGKVNKAGDITLTGTITCSHQANFVDLKTFVRQAVGRFTFSGGTVASVDCGPTPESWTLAASADNGTFGGGKVQVEIIAFGCSPTSCGQTADARTVRLGR